jgi:hypothetical protein
MLATLCFILAIVCWALGFFNVTLNAGGQPRVFGWLCGGLAFAGLGLWIAPLIH